jgi:uncharacterized Zn finger protein (UPF0148 family)
MNIVQRKAYLNINGFTKHKANKRGTTIIFSRKHTTDASVRVVVDSGIDSNTGRITTPINAKLVFINRDNHWRDITTTSTAWTDLEVLVKKAEDQINFVPICKHCQAKKFTAKSGKVVCANACWVTWSGKAKKKSQKKSQKTAQKSSETVAQKKSPRTYNKKSQKTAAIYSLDIKPGDLVTMELYNPHTEKVTENYEGKVLGIATEVHGDNVKTMWTSNTSTMSEHYLPSSRRFQTHRNAVRRFKVLSRKVEWKKE